MAFRPAAAEDLAGREVVAALEVASEQIVLGITGEPAWPTVRTRLLLVAHTAPTRSPNCGRPLAAANTTPQRSGPPLWTGDSTTPATATPGPGPLPWLPGIPASVPQQALPVCPGKESVLEARRPSVDACCY